MDGECCNGCEEDKTGSKWIFHSVSTMYLFCRNVVFGFFILMMMCVIFLEYRNFVKQDEIVRDVTGEVPFFRSFSKEPH